MNLDNHFNAIENSGSKSLKLNDHPEMVAAMSTGRGQGLELAGSGNQKIDWLPDVFFTNDSAAANTTRGQATQFAANNVFLSPKRGDSQNQVKLRSADGRVDAEDLHYRITDGDQLGKTDCEYKPELKMPTVDQLRHASPEELSKMYQQNQELLQEYLRTQLPKLPDVIGFHGGTQKSNNIWIGTKGDQLVPPEAHDEKAGNKSNITWGVFVPTKSTDVAELVDQLGHAFEGADSYANPHWIKGPFVPGGVSLIDASGMESKHQIKEGHKVFGDVEIGWLGGGWNKNFDNIYKGTIDYRPDSEYRKFIDDPSTPSDQRIDARKFLQQQMVLETIALLAGKAGSGEGVENGRAPRLSGELPPIIDDTKPSTNFGTADDGVKRNPAEREDAWKRLADQGWRTEPFKKMDEIEIHRQITNGMTKNPEKWQRFKDALIEEGLIHQEAPAPSPDRKPPIRVNVDCGNGHKTAQVIEPGSGDKTAQVIEPGSRDKTAQVIEPGSGDKTAQVIEPGSGYKTAV